MSSTVKRIKGDYTIELVDGNDVLTLNTENTVITGDLTVVGNAVLTGNINADRIFNGTSNVEITTPGGNVQIGVGGIADVLDVGTAGMAVTGVVFASGNVTGANINTAGLASVSGNITGGNINTAGNVWITRDASAAQPTIRFTDTDTTLADGQILGAIEWFTSDASPGARVTNAIRSRGNSTQGNANVEILTSTSGAAATVKVTVQSTGNVGIGNAEPLHLLTVGGTAYVSSSLTAVGNITGSNIATAGLITATGNVTSGNVNSGAAVSAVGNVIANNVNASQQVTAGALGVSATGNITGGNILSDGIISATGNLTATDFIGTSLSVSGNVQAGNASIGNAISASDISTANAVISTSLTGNAVGVTNYVYQGSDAVISSATPVDIGSLSFTAAANNAYRFEAYIPLVPDGAMTVAPAVNFSAGSCFYTTETQSTSTGAFAAVTKTASDDVATTHAMTGTDARTLRITGWFFHTVDTAVTMRLQNSTGNITAKTGAHLGYTRVA